MALSERLALAIHEAGTITVFWVASLSLIVVFLVFEKYAEAILFAVGLILFVTIVAGLKVATKVPRPKDRLVEVEWGSFPSGHAGGATFFAAMTTYDVSRYLGADDTVPLGLSLFIWAGLVSWSRLKLKVHRPLEVAAGVSIALTITAFVIAFQEPMTETLLPLFGQ